MEANLKTLLANVRPEEVTEEEVVLYDGARVLNGGIISLPESINNFEYLIFNSAVGVVGEASTLNTAPTQVSPSDVLNTSIDEIAVGVSIGNGSFARIRIIPTLSTDTSLYVEAANSSSLENAGVYKVVGYKRRYSKTSLAEITEAASKPNLFINTWHAGAKVRNQRNFDGNWSALAIGDYGLDMWLKTSATHKGFIVEAGSYKPSTKHTVVADDGAILGTVISPADGGHWLHAFPFASDKFSIREGDIPLGWSPDTDSRLDECNKHFIRRYADGYVVERSSLVSSDAGSLYRKVSVILGGMRKSPTVLWNLYEFSSGVSEEINKFSASKIYNVSAASKWGGYTDFTADATIALSEVTDDAEHRVVWG